MAKKVVFTAPVLSNSGYGVHSRQVLYALTGKCGLDVVARPLRWGEVPFISQKDSPEKSFIIGLVGKSYSWQQAKIQPDISVFISVPPEFQRMAPASVGITAGVECDRVPPQWIIKANEMDLMIVPSEFTKSTFINTKYQGSDGSMLQCTVPIEVIPESVDTSIFNDIHESDIDLDLPPFCFITSGQWGIGIDRKNIEGIIRVFKEAFRDHPDKEQIGLVMKVSSIGASYIDETHTINKIKSIVKEYDQFPKIILVHGHMPDKKLAQLYKDTRVKAGVFLTHGEGYGLCIQDLAACNKPIIASNATAHTEFLNLGKWIKIPCELKESGIKNDIFAEGNRWWFPDHAEAVRHLKKMYQNYDIPKKWAEELGAKIRETLNIKVIEDKYYEIFDKYNLLKENENTIADSIFKNENLEEIVAS